MTEKGEIKRDGATAMRNSGRGMYQKGDARLDIFTVDYKEYDKSFGVSRAVWAKICNDAMANGHTEPMLKLVLGTGQQRLRLCVVAEGIIEDYIRLRQFEEEWLDNARDKRD